MAYGTLQTDVINSSTGLFSTNNAYSGIAKAWVNFTGSTINGSFNVSSITVNASGDYSINFTTAMANTNYAMAGAAQIDTSNTAAGLLVVTLGRWTGNPSTSSLRVSVVNSANTATAPSLATVVVLGS
jgi:hypothetical protein